MDARRNDVLVSFLPATTRVLSGSRYCPERGQAGTRSPAWPVISPRPCRWVGIAIAATYVWRFADVAFALVIVWA